MEELLRSILAEMAERGMVFSNEQDFQFELALALNGKEAIEKVKLEAMSLSRKWQGNAIKGNEKEYTDLIVKTSDGKFYAIEIKDKHSNKQEMYYSKECGRVLLMNHGAEYYNSFYFWEDVCRLEKINTRFFPKNITIEKGYVIFLSNDRKYWNPGEINDDIWRLFSMEEGREVGQGSLGTKEKFEDHKTVFKNRFPNIQHTYTLNWENYPVQAYRDENFQEQIAGDEFKYLLVEVDPIQIQKIDSAEPLKG